MADRTPDEQLPAEHVMERIASMAEALSADPRVGTDVVELLDWVDAFHREGLGRLVEMIRAWRGEIFLEAVAGDDVAGALLAAYDLGEGGRESAERAVERAMAEIRPLVASHGGDITIVRVEDGVVEVRLVGTCVGCPSAPATLSHGVEDALRRHWVSFRRLEVTPAAPPDPAKDDLTCPMPAPAAPAPIPAEPLLQIRGHEQA